MADFVRKATKKSLLSMLRRADKVTPRLLARLFEGVMFKDEYDTASGGGGAFVRTDGSTPLTANWDAGSYEIRAQTLESDVTTGTAPLTIASTTVVANLNVDKVDGKDETAFVLVDGTRALTGNWDAGSYEIRAQTLEADVATGTAPLTIASTTLVSNLNSDLLDSQEGSYYLNADNHTYTVTTQTDAALTLDATHNTVLCDATSNAVTITLPTASGISGKIYNIKAINVDNTVSVDPNGAEEIDGDATTMTLALMESITIQSDGSNWWII